MKEEFYFATFKNDSRLGVIAHTSTDLPAELKAVSANTEMSLEVIAEILRHCLPKYPKGMQREYLAQKRLVETAIFLLDQACSVTEGRRLDE